ncbi:hypothetical protein [Yaniella halotolerans]|uniref:hypothetical protein n=1 Tax=Yaniella halotolerans TaxID=225453 RepID=UPI0003B4633A|nr:hypothetical protein [Yaniella halotolerans]
MAHTKPLQRRNPLLAGYVVAHPAGVHHQVLMALTVATTAILRVTLYRQKCIRQIDKDLHEPAQRVEIPDAPGSCRPV